MRSNVQGARNLVDVVPDTPKLDEDVAEDLKLLRIPLWLARQVGQG
jgi:hypothetical protein